ncbi:hypothetical protein EQW78_12565 [Oerskovia turbata]|uniref:Uncharacterized protein n=1 Tax=Oerskovia turbata TaxID=1713 RepID=A0A4Q1KS00_9CELL|nr:MULTISPECIES: hypothetical protein [Oerskovia]QDW62543.1 hypothetical protein FFI11_008325 [Oerskovia sp. KBS0722]RXR23557.1 hypothetical protein EQW73_14585 [Oerskovia turbata]RXR32827.1 hypothetical protein EQW78_12565 [Oerskovia turbata]TGJ95125.1 hypothetical protein DLJ96_16005 [Actinotalea fermentans ATCC 43279 = JCM 9966 = DSM 3133]
MTLRVDTEAIDAAAASLGTIAVTLADRADDTAQHSGAAAAAGGHAHVVTGATDFGDYWGAGLGALAIALGELATQFGDAAAAYAEEDRVLASGARDLL